MVSIWGSSGRNDQRTTEDGHTHPDYQHQEPDERTRLISRSAPNEGYLSPDDPAVSPYNLWSVRALRFFTCLFLAISFVWWVFLLVSIFVSPPLMYNRGSGFTDFSYTTLTVGNLIVSLLFFTIPSKPMIMWNSVLALFLLVGMIIIVAVPRIRLEEGWVGIASIVWAILISIYNIAQVYFVEKGKEEEEERLTGRVETRRSLFEWVSVLVETIVLGVIALVTILLTATLILRARDSSLEVPGKRYLVNNEKYEVHLACVGSITTGDNKTPTILLEAGETPAEHALQPFIHNTYRNGTIDRYCYWDRPGFGWSDNAPSPHSAGMAADALSEALALAGEEGPWILVSAGVGSIYSRIFASRHIHDIKGLFMIDPTHEDQLQQIGKAGRGFVLWGRGIISPLGLDRLAGAIFKGRTREDRVYGKVSYQNGKYIKAKLQENLVAESMTSSEVASAKNIQTPETPLVVVSSGVEVRKNEKWAKQQEEMTKVTDNLVSWDVVKGAGHEVWRSWEGKKVLERRLGELVKQA
ncbi:mitochondrial integral membrane protein [Talaromyces stipitatus ATCC 10500]|uniref:Mitochondrial integral membrane protein n=1 Tax=Talaromyces stipitatus (strain ATCC 10500 / CBS 375.48 / QM 6759 / NRRL 1006) TaxID=441959 RepID=B8MHB0_TALSN|nr:mitochondrial integral membrane protein [Talaromyces stipitatus ATCC 10500]EED17089.1 mitochondrial integral membrane protein [Talaromyces stipitatus ATCC 10500]